MFPLEIQLLLARYVFFDLSISLKSNLIECSSLLTSKHSDMFAPQDIRLRQGLPRSRSGGSVARLQRSRSESTLTMLQRQVHVRPHDLIP